MAERVFLSEIVGKIALDKDSVMLGPIEDIVIDTSTGFVKYLVLGSGVKVSEMVDDLGRAVVPVGGMRIETEYVIVTR